MNQVRSGYIGTAMIDCLSAVLFMTIIGKCGNPQEEEQQQKKDDPVAKKFPLYLVRPDNSI